MKKRRRRSGSLTVYFSMVMAAWAMLMVVLYLSEQVMLAQIRGRQILDLCASSTLAGYNDILYQQYGFLAIESQSIADADMKAFLKMNLDPYQLDELELTAEGYLTDAEEYEHQLAQFMQLRYPLTLVDQYTDFFKELETIKDVSEAIDEAISVEELLETYSDLFAQCIEKIIGVDDTGKTVKEYVNGFYDEDWVREDLKEELLAEKPYKKALKVWKKHAVQYAAINQEAVGLWDELIAEGARIRPQLEASLDNSELEAQQEEIRNILAGLHDGSESDQQIRTQLQQNADDLTEGAAGLESMLDEDEQVQETGRKGAKKILAYRADIQIAYELHAQNKKAKVWRKLWKKLQNYKTDLSDYVEDTEILSADAMLTLPSGGQENGISLADLSLTELSKLLGADIREAVQIVLHKAYAMEYANGMFWNLREVIENKENGTVPESIRGTEKPEGMLKAEVEYILAGKGNDLSNCESVRLSMVGLRMLSNIFFLMTDPEKKAVIESMSAAGGIVIPGLGNAILKGLIIAVWAGAESYHDYELLIHGKNVPILKDAESWKTDIESLAEDIAAEDTGEETDAGRGLGYAEYLKILLLFLPQNTLDRRTQDLIQMHLEKETGLKVYLSDMITQFQTEGSFRDTGRKYSMKGEYGYE